MGGAQGLALVIAEMARTFPSRDQFRAAVMELLAEQVGFDDSLFHFMDKSEPFERGHFITPIQKWVIVEAIDRWHDRYSPELEPLWNAAEKNGGAAVDTEVFGRDARSRLNFYREIVPNTLGLRHFMWCHLDVHGERVCTVAFGRRRGSFREADQRCLSQLRDVLALAEKCYRSSRRALDGEVVSRLTPRELEVVDLVVRGLTNPEIASALTLSFHTVRNHLLTIFRKLGVASRAELAGLAALRLP